MLHYITEVSKEERAYIEWVTLFLYHESFSDRYDYAGGFTIAGSVEEAMACGHVETCCGTAEFSIHCPTGRRLYLVFDYGH